MIFDPDDPRLTAFALGELDDAGESARIKSLLAENAEARVYVEDVRRAARLLAESLRLETAPGNATERLEALDRALSGLKSRRKETILRRLRPSFSYAVAAAIAALAIGLSIQRRTERLRERADEAEALARADLGSKDSPPASAPAPIVNAPSPSRDGKSFESKQKKRLSEDDLASLGDGDPPEERFFARGIDGLKQAPADSPSAAKTKANRRRAGDLASNFVAPKAVELELQDRVSKESDKKTARNEPSPPSLQTLKQNRSRASDRETAVSLDPLRRSIRKRSLPSRDEVRIDRLLDFYRATDSIPPGNEPIAATVEVASCPWNPARELARVSLSAGRTIAKDGSGKPIALRARVRIECDPVRVVSRRLLGRDDESRPVDRTSAIETFEIASLAPGTSKVWFLELEPSVGLRDSSLAKNAASAAAKDSIEVGSEKRVGQPGSAGEAASRRAKKESHFGDVSPSARSSSLGPPPSNPAAASRKSATTASNRIRDESLEQKLEASSLKAANSDQGKSSPAPGDALLKVTIFYETPGNVREEETTRLGFDRGIKYSSATADFRFGAAVAEFGLLLRDAPEKGSASFDEVLRLAEPVAGDDPHRREFLDLVRQAQKISGR